VGYILAIPLLPAAVFFVFFLMPRAVRNRLVFVPITAMAASTALSVFAFWTAWPGGEELAGHPLWEVVYRIGMVGRTPVDLILRLDPLTAVMLLVVTIVGLCVQVYSLSYMHDEERIGWYYAVLSLFTAAMLILVLAADYLTFYMSWEIMGLCSYLLIGFWFQYKASRDASLKAFLVTRVGDVGFAIGLAMIWINVGSFSFDQVLPAATTWGPVLATWVALMLFFGAMGKSAQFPLHVWLPDAMAGPTPASALIHAATMVAAGVFLVARSMPIFVASGVMLQVVMWIGALTAFMAATMGAVQYDIKKVLAYSTISQLGFMFIGLGTGNVAAGMFHLFTHAFFKSLLFLGAGSIIHSINTQDMREMGGVARKMKVTTVTFTIGTLALAGIFPLSGFFSKDAILDSLWAGKHYTVFVLALLAAGLTAFYMARLWFRVFPGKTRTPSGEHMHESDWKMLGPMVVLAGITLVIGFAVVVFGSFVGGEATWPQLWLGGLSTAFALVGIALGFALFGGGRDAERLKATQSRVYAIVVNKYFLDVVYEDWIAGSYLRLSEGVNWFDRVVINGIVNGVGAANTRAGDLLRRIQDGDLRNYQRLLVGGAIVFILVVVMARGV
jgi:NADH-quinone oxidoreductase subunit L